MRLRKVLRSTSNHSLRIPLRVVLIVPFILQISIAVGLTAFLSIRNGQQAVNEVAAELRNEVTARIQQHLSNYMETPQLVTQINADAVHFGSLNLQDTEGLERHFWQQMRQFPSLRPIAFGSAQGEIHAVDRATDGSLVIRVIDPSTQGEYHTYSVDAKGNRQTLIRVSNNFDPRTRPWYQKAVSTHQPTWTEVYPYFSSLGLAISASRPLYNAQGQLLGVTNATLSLAELSGFLSNIKIGQTGQTFIIERSGDLVASSTIQQPFILRESGTEEIRERLAAIASPDPVTRSTTQYLLQRFGSFNHIDTRQQLDFSIQGKRQFLQLTPFRDRYGLDWLIVVVVPEADFMEQIEVNTRTTVLLCLAALGVATLSGILTAQWITQPITRIIAAAEQIAGGKLEQTVSTRGITEMEVLVTVFNQMAAQLQSSFAALEAANTELEDRVTQRTTQLQERTLELKQAFELEATLKRITDRVRDTLDESQILQTVVQELTTTLEAECCMASRYDLEQKTVIVNDKHTQPQWVVGLGHPVQHESAPDVYQELLRGECLQFCQLVPASNQPQTAILACPVWGDEGVLADIWLLRKPDCIYSEPEVRLVQQVANQCAIAIRQARLYQTAQAQVEELQKLHSLKDDFLNTVSHELRTPVSNMKLAIRMLQIANNPERQQQYMGILETECKREADLINDLLDLQRLEAERYPIFMEEIHLETWIPNIIQPFLSRVQERQQVLTVHSSTNLLPIMSSPSGLERILAELLNNACKYTAAQREIRFNVYQSDQSGVLRTQFEVSNQAEIPASEIPHIFDKFYRVPRADPWKQGGTGLGLALVKRLVEQLQGEIRVDSEAGWTTFTVLFSPT